MAQTGFTPIKIYSSSTAAVAPSAANLSNTNGSELAINITDGKLYYKDNLGAVQVIAYKNVPVSTLSGLGANVATFLATPTSANLAAAVTNETGSGALVFATSPTMVTPNLGTPSTLVGTNITGTAAGLSIGGNAATATTATNQSGGSVNATTGAFSGALTSTNIIQTNGGYVASGVGSGATALTTNDGYGNANLAFNHTNGIPDITGSSARITSPVDSSGAAMTFQLGSNTTAGVAVALPSTVLTLVPTLVSTQVPLSVTGTATATSFSGAGTGLTGTAAGLSIGGNAATATTSTTATTATNATNTAITNDIATNATMYPTWVTATTGNLPQRTSSTKLTFNPSTGTLTTTTFSGSGASLTALNASNLSSGTVPDARISGSYTGMTNLTGSGSVDFAKFLGLAADTVSAPSFTWTGDLTTGFYRPAASQVAVTIAGTQRGLFTSGGLNINGVVATARIDTNNGTQLVLNAGESAGQATGQTGEFIYLNAEEGVQINSSPDNWATGWATRNTLTLCNPAGQSIFPGTVTAPTFSGALSGNATTATTLQTARTLTIGATGKTFNGSANVAWSLAEIGAQAAGNYVTTDTTQTITGLKTISVSTASDAFRITQTGAGNAFVVEDSTSPDSSPFVIDTNGKVISGYTTAISNIYDPQTTTPRSVSFQNIGTTSDSAGIASISYATSGGNAPFYAPAYYLARSKGASIGTNGAVSDGDALGSIVFSGDDGTNFVSAAQIRAYVDGTPGTNDMPGRLAFFTTADGASTTTERMTINSAGNVGIGITPTEKLHVSGNILSTGSIDCGTQFLGLLTDTASAPSFSFTGNTNTGMFRPAVNQLGFSTNGAARLTVTTGQITTTLALRGQNGSVAAPAFSASADTNTGMYFPAADTIGFAEGGADVMRITSAGDVGIGTITPASKLDVVGTVTATSFTGSGAGITNVSLTTGVTGTLPIANGGTNATTAAGARTSLGAQETLVSGTNIKTVNGSSLLGSGDVVISGVPDGDKGDITVSASGATWTIDSGVVTPAKLSTGGPYWDTADNVGIGTSSPAAWQGTGLQISDRSALFQLTINNSTYLANNLAYDGTNWRYIATGAGLVYSVGALGIASVFRAASGTAGAIATLVESTRADASGNFLFDSGYGLVATAYGCRAWVNFNGTGTVAIRASGNVSSITDNGVGNYTVNMTTAMPDGNYSIAGSAGKNDTAGDEFVAFAPSARIALGSFGWRVSAGSGAASDVDAVHAQVFR